MPGDEQTNSPTRTLGQAIDVIINALKDLDEASRATAIRASCDHLGIGQPSQGTPLNRQISQTQTLPEGGTRVIDIRILKEEKQPRNYTEMAALVAYYLSEIATGEEKKTEVDVNDMIKYFKIAPFQLPKATRVLLTNAKKAGYFESVGDGKFKLNPVGYNLVAHNLPRKDNPPQRISTRRKSRNKPQSRRSRK